MLGLVAARVPAAEAAERRRAARACTPYAAMKRCATAAEVPGPTVSAEAPHPGPKELLMARRVHPRSKTHKHTRLSSVD